MTEAQGVPILTAATQATAVKPAYRTTEGWLNFATGALGAAVTAGLIGPDSTIAKLGGMVLMLAATAIHTWSRTSIKNAAAAP